MNAEKNYSETERLHELRVRPVRPADMPWVAARFPWTLRLPTQAHFLLAENENRSLVGGCCFTVESKKRGETYALINLHPEANAPAKPVCSALLQVLRRRAWAGGWRSLFYRSVLEGSVLENVLLAENFQRVSSVTFYEVDGATFWKKFDATYQRLQKSGKIPESMRIVALRDAPAIAVTELIQKCIGSDAMMMEKQFGTKQFSEEHSKIVQVGPTVIAAMLVQISDGIPEIAYMAIDSKHRNSWIYVGFVRELTRQLMEQGHKIFRYRTNPSNHAAPANTAARLEGKILGREMSYELKLNPR